jgi:hypothetical protein
MDKQQIVMALLEKMNNDTRSAGLQNGIDLMQIEQQIISNHDGLVYLLSSLYDFIIEKNFFKD